MAFSLLWILMEIERNLQGMPPSYGMLHIRFFFHNMKDINLRLDMGSDFLAQLLRFIDCFQAWGRENLYENLFDGECFERVVLRRFELAKDSNSRDRSRLTMAVDYLPLRFVSPTDSAIGVKEDRLRDVIREHYNSLGRMGLNKESGVYDFHNIILRLQFLHLR